MKANFNIGGFRRFDTYPTHGCTVDLNKEGKQVTRGDVGAWFGPTLRMKLESCSGKSSNVSGTAAANASDSPHRVSSTFCKIRLWVDICRSPTSWKLAQHWA